MNCPICIAWTTVEQTKSLGVFVERRRKCANNHTFSTEERIVPPKKRGRQVTTKEKNELSDRITPAN